MDGNYFHYGGGVRRLKFHFFSDYPPKQLCGSATPISDGIFLALTKYSNPHLKRKSVEQLDLGMPSCKKSAVFLTLFKRPLTPPPFI